MRFVSKLPLCLTLCIMATVAGCAKSPQSPAKPQRAPAPETGLSQSKYLTSFYGRGDGLGGNKTASGEKMQAAELTAAHRTLPFGTRLKLTDPKTGKSVVVRINDRGPFTKGRDLDISYAAAQALGIEARGVVELVGERV